VRVPEETDEELMLRYVDRDDPAAFEVIFRRYAGRLTGFFRRSGCHDALARDLVQTTFLHVHRARRDFRRDAKLRPWIFTIAMNVRREHFRKVGRRPEAPLDGGHEPPVAPDASSSSDRLVRRALDKLPEQQREVIWLHWYQQLTFPEIAEVVGATGAAVRVRAHRGYELLRKLLDPGT
jgi:RNA polymerase sigma-70 factor (ECF subfamily)